MKFQYLRATILRNYDIKLIQTQDPGLVFQRGFTFTSTKFKDKAMLDQSVKTRKLKAISDQSVKTPAVAYIELNLAQLCRLQKHSTI